jgi:hypothetical protein
MSAECKLEIFNRFIGQYGMRSGEGAVSAQLSSTVCTFPPHLYLYHYYLSIPRRDRFDAAVLICS